MAKKKTDENLYYYVKIVSKAGAENAALYDTHLCKTKDEAKAYRIGDYPPDKYDRVIIPIEG